MPGTRNVVAVILASCSMVTVPGAVAANGGSFFRFDRKYFAPGEVATAQTTFSAKVEQSGSIDDGPYYAFLLSSERWIQPPRIPEDAIAVGRVDIVDLGGTVPVARIEFTVPQIRPGHYTLTLCNLPCTHATLGDLAGGSLSIVPTKEVALRKELSDRFNARVAQVRANLAARIRTAEKAQQSFAPSSEVEELTERVTALQERIAGMQRAQRRESPTAVATAWIVAALVLLIAGLLSLRSRLRQERPTARRRRWARRDEAIPMVLADEEDLSEVREPSAREFETADL